MKNIKKIKEINKKQEIFIKGFDKDLKCRDMQFEVGKVYKIKNNGELKLCTDTVFHFCRNISQIHDYYSCEPTKNNRFCEIEVLGNLIEDSEKCGSDSIKIIREIKGDELKRLLGLDRNIGLFNSGDRNSGDRNSGYQNSGDRNSGDRNSGDRNSGYGNSGYRNSGDLNSGYQNSGDGNSGDRNRGYRNSGDLNSGYRNSGIFCTRKRTDTVLLFNKESNMTWDDWFNHPAYEISCNLELTAWINWYKMTEEEKIEYPKSYVCGGYLKVFEYKEAWRILWNKLSEKDKSYFKELPNFDSKIFEEITGILY